MTSDYRPGEKDIDVTAPLRSPSSLLHHLCATHFPLACFVPSPQEWILLFFFGGRVFFFFFFLFFLFFFFFFSFAVPVVCKAFWVTMPGPYPLGHQGTPMPLYFKKATSCTLPQAPLRLPVILWRFLFQSFPSICFSISLISNHEYKNIGGGRTRQRVTRSLAWQTSRVALVSDGTLRMADGG